MVLQQAQVALAFSPRSPELILVAVALADHGTPQVASAVLVAAEMAVMEAVRFAVTMALQIPVAVAALWVMQSVPTAPSAQVEVALSFSAMQRQARILNFLRQVITSFNMPKQLIPLH